MQTVQVVQWKGRPGTSERLSVSIIGADAHQLISEKAALKLVTENGPCGTIDFWVLNVRVTADGTLKTLGWVGHPLSPATVLPTPTPTPTAT